MTDGPPQGVSFSPTDIEQILTLLHERHGVHLDPGEAFEVSGQVSHGGVDLTLRLADPDESDVLTLDAHLDLEANDVQDPTDGRDALLDFMDGLLSTYFEQERALGLRDDWREYATDDGKAILLRGSRRNLKLERMADALLAEAE